MSKTFKEILDAVIANNHQVIDDHRSGSRELKLAGIATLKGNGQAVALCDSIYFSLNRVYLNAGDKPHVSKESVGGVVLKYDNPLKKAVELYNDQQAQSLTDAYVLENVTLF